MAWRRFALALAAGLAVWLTGAEAARGALVRQLVPGHGVRMVNDRFLPAETPWAGPSASPEVPAAAPAVRFRTRPTPRPVTVVSVLRSLKRRDAITAEAFRAYQSQWTAALAAERRLSGTRAAELSSVTINLHDMAAAGELTASRLPALFLTLKRNVEWWTTGPLLASGDRVEFAGSQLVWEYYPGQGIELQELGSFGKADGLFTAGRAHYAQMESLLREIIPLAADRAGGLAWEYYFSFDGGSPPWISAMAQGTALEALARAYRASHDRTYLEIAHEALPPLAVRPPAGVALSEPDGTRFLQYSFAPDTDIINAFLQTLIGLYDYARVSHDRTARALFAAGNAEAQAELPSFNTGAWSLYQPGLEDDLSYHELVTGFVQGLCQRTHAPVYCRTAADFQADLHTPPTLTQLTTRIPARQPFALRFRLSKISHVGIVLQRGGQTILATSADFPYGIDAFSVAGLTAGSYEVRLAATDLAGNFNRIVGTLVVFARRHRRHH